MTGGVFKSILRRIFLRNFALKFIAALLTLALFVWVSEDRETIVAGYAQLQIVVPDGMVLVSDPVDRVKFTVRGRWNDINRFDPSNLDPIRIDLSPADTDTVVSLTPNMIGVPPNLRVTAVEPSSMYVDLEPESFKTVPINPQIVGEPGRSYTVEDVRVSPQTVTLRGPTSRLEGINSVPTEPIDISNRTRSLQRTAQPEIIDGLITAELDEPITVEILIETEEVTETLSDIPVEAVNTSYETTIDPPSAQLTVTGPKPVIEGLDPGLIRPEIDLSDEDGRPPGRFSRTAEVFNLPPNVELVNIYPERFRVTTTSPPEPVVDEQEQSDMVDGESDSNDEL